MSELLELESIINSKPGGATHVDGEGNYYKFAGMHGINRFNLFSSIWVSDRDFSLCRSLADIQKQIDQLKEIDKLKDTIDYLDGQLDAWAEKYADLKIKSDANQWAHDNMQEQLANAKVDAYLECVAELFENAIYARENGYPHLLDCLLDLHEKSDIFSQYGFELEGEG